MSRTGLPEHYPEFLNLITQIAAVADLSRQQLDAISNAMELDTAEVQTLFILAERENKTLAKHDLDIQSSPLLTGYLARAIAAVEDAAQRANTSPAHFRIDQALCDCGAIKTDQVVDALDEAARLYSTSIGRAYDEVLNAMCEALTAHFE